MPTPRPAPLSRRLLLAGLATGAALFTLPGCASEPSHGQGLATLEVYDRDSGRLVPTYTRHGRQYVPGRPGARYALRLRNLTDRRVLVVLSVDGINVINGQTADWSQTGYVLDARRWYDINGWRKSDTEVAAFEFAPIERSYAARTGRPDHVGVIGMAVFRELVPVRPALAPVPPAVARSETGPAPTAAAPAGPPAPGAALAGAARDKVAQSENSSDERSTSRLGTGHGQREWSVSRRTAFERASATPDQLLQIEYDSFERLVAAGVIPRQPVPADRPSPFPNSPMAFVPDPPRW